MENKKISNKEFNSLSKPDLIRMSNYFRNEFFNYVSNPELFEASIATYKIIFKIMGDLRNSHFNNKDKGLNKIQYSLFENEFKTHDNTYARFSYQISELDKHRNYKTIENALSFLANYKKGWYTHKNSSGQMIKSYGGLISEPSYTKGKVSFLISSYWMEKLTFMNEYNELLYSLIDKLKEPKHILFYMWILHLNNEGTRIKFTTFIERFKLNNKSYVDLYKNLLYPLRQKFNKFSNVSFNTSFDGKYINFSKQLLIPSNDNIILQENTVDKLKIQRRAHYLKLRHELSNDDYLELKKTLEKKEIFDKVDTFYNSFVKECRANKIKADTIKGDHFMKKLKNFMTN